MGIGPVLVTYISGLEPSFNKAGLNALVKLPALRAEPFDNAIRQVHGGESNRTAHGPEDVEGLLGKVASFVLCPLTPL